MADKNLGVGLTFSARDLASGPIGLLSNNFGRLRQSVRGGMPQVMAGFAALGAGVASTAAGLGTLRGAFDLATFAGSFNQEMAAVRSITQASAEDFNALNEAAIEAGIVTKFSPEEAAGGLRVLSQQGLIAQDAIGGLVPVLDFAAAGNIEVAEAAEVAMGVMNAYGMEVDQMTSVTDRLMRGTQLSALSANEFITVMGRAASTGRVFGTNLDDVILSLGSMRSAGIPATVATTALGEAMRRLATDENSAEVLRRFGVATEDAGGNLRSVIDITRDFQTAIEDRTEAEQAALVNQVFGVRGMREFSAIANIQARVMRDGALVTIRGAEAIAHYRRELQNAGGTTERFRRDRAATFAGQMELLAGAVAALKTVFGEVFGEVLRPVILSVTDAVSAMVRIWRSLSDNGKKIVGVMVLVGGVLAVVFGVVMTVVGAVLVLVAVLGELLITAAAIAGGIALAMIPIAIAIGAVIAAGYALYEAYRQNLGGLGDIVNGFVDKVTLAWTALGELLSGDSLSDAIREQLGEEGNEGVRSFVFGVRDMVRRLQAVWRGFRDGFAQVWEGMAPVFAQLGQAFRGLWGQITAVARVLLGSGAAVPFDRFESFGEMLANVAGGALRWVVLGITEVVRTLTWLIGTIRAFHASPFGQIFRANVGAIILLVTWIFRLGVAITRLLNYINPIRLLGQALSGVASWLGFGGAETPRPEETGNPAQELTRGRRDRESADRTEAATARPAASEAEGRNDATAAILAQLGGERRGERTTRLQNRVSLDVDGRQLAEVLQEIGVDNATGAGGVVTNEFGFTPAPA